jgi:hypothetical protein
MPYKVNHPLKNTLEDIALNRLGKNMLSPGITTEIKTLDDRTKTLETSITQTNEELALKATQSEVNALGMRVEAAETAITLNSQQIELKASQESVNDLGERMAAAETNITQNANAITLKADKTELSTTYAQDTAPVIPNIGDLWCDTSNNNELKRWNGTSWVSLRDTSFIGGNITYAQDSPPANPNSGDIWIDTTYGKNIIKRWDGSGWVELRDSDIPELITWKQGFQEITPDHIRSTVLEVYPNGVEQQSVIEQQADSISQRLIAKDETGNPVANASIEISTDEGGTVKIAGKHINISGDVGISGTDDTDTYDINFSANDGVKVINKNTGEYSQLNSERLYFYKKDTQDILRPLPYKAHIESGIVQSGSAVTYSVPFTEAPLLMTTPAYIGASGAWQIIQENPTAYGFTPKVQLLGQPVLHNEPGGGNLVNTGTYWETSFKTAMAYRFIINYWVDSDGWGPIDISYKLDIMDTNNTVLQSTGQIYQVNRGSGVLSGNDTRDFSFATSETRKMRLTLVTKYWGLFGAAGNSGCSCGGWSWTEAASMADTQEATVAWIAIER